MSAQQKTNKPTLAYWKIRGLAQPIRLLLNYVEEEFNDVQYEQGDGPEFSKKAWTDIKNDFGLDFPNLPYYIDGDVRITQSNSILRHIARKHKMMGKTLAEEAYADMMLEQAMDFRNGVVRMVYNPDYKNMLEAYKKDKLSELLDSFEKRLNGRKWFAGDNLTVADFPMYELLDQHKLMISEDCLKAYKNLTAFMTRFEELPQIKKYMKGQNFIKRPVNNKVAQFK